MTFRFVRYKYRAFFLLRQGNNGVQRCQIGDGVGGSEKKLTGFYTIQQCSDAVKLQFPNANGFTRSEPCPNQCQCFAEFGMTGWDSKRNWQSCKFSNTGKLIYGRAIVSFFKSRGAYNGFALGRAINNLGLFLAKFWRL